ncbi:MAG: hypothetical protein OHK0013_32260 [Sandaracinaceae bacterium]
MMRAPSALGSALAVLALALAGCPGPRCPAPTLRFTDGADVVRQHERLLAWAENLRAEARVDRRDRDARVRGTVLMMAERPDRVRFDAMTQFGPAAVLTSDGEAFALTDLRENRFFAGPTCADNIALLLGIPMEAEDIGRVLFGESPVIEAAEREVSCDHGSYRVTLRAADGARQTLVYDVRQSDLEGPIEAQRLRLRESVLVGADGALSWRIRWDDHRFVVDPRSAASPQEGVAMPFRVQVEIPAQSIDTLVRFEHIEINVDLPEGVFSQDVRPGLTVEPVECAE